MKNKILFIVGLSFFVSCSAIDDFVRPVPVSTVLLLLRNGVSGLRTSLEACKHVTVAFVTAVLETGDDIWIKPYI
jgi:hypothetical protein